MNVLRFPSSISLALFVCLFVFCLSSCFTFVSASSVSGLVGTFSIDIDDGALSDGLYTDVISPITNKKPILFFIQGLGLQRGDISYSDMNATLDNEYFYFQVENDSCIMYRKDVFTSDVQTQLYTLTQRNKNPPQMGCIVSESPKLAACSYGPGMTTDGIRYQKNKYNGFKSDLPIVNETVANYANLGYEVILAGQFTLLPESSVLDGLYSSSYDNGRGIFNEVGNSSVRQGAFTRPFIRQELQGEEGDDTDYEETFFDFQPSKKTEYIFFTDGIQQTGKDSVEKVDNCYNGILWAPMELSN